MTNPLPAFEIYAELTVAQTAKLLGIAAPTYYQYRRTGKMPDIVVGYVDVLMRCPKQLLESLIRERVYGDDEL